MSESTPTNADKREEINPSKPHFKEEEKPIDKNSSNNRIKQWLDRSPIMTLGVVGAAIVGFAISSILGVV